MTRFNDNYSVAHNWAHQRVPNGRGSNFYFEDRVIYSYGAHFPIAYLQDHLVFFTTRGYSMSTKRHISLARSAVSHKEIIYVQEVPTSSEMVASFSWWQGNVNYFVGHLRSLVEELQQHPRRTSVARAIDNCRYHLQQFLTHTGRELSNDIAEMLAHPTIEGIALVVEKQGEQAAAREKKRYKKAVAAWKKGVGQYVENFDSKLINNNQAYLRYNPECQLIETSKGVDLTPEECRLFWLYMQRYLQTKATEVMYKIQGFGVDVINPRFFKVGCHTIAMSEAKRIARYFGW